MNFPELYKSPVVFDNEYHTYQLNGKYLKGVTSTLVQRAFPHTYEGISDDVLANAAERGTKIHLAIQEYEDNFILSDSQELISYVQIKDEHNLTHLASEYLVSDEKNYASMIDHVFLDEDGNIILADIKTTYEPHYENVALQLSVYKRFFEMQNPDLHVKAIALIWLRYEKSEYRELPVWADEALDMLIDADLEDAPFDITKTYGDLPQKVYDVQQYLMMLDADIKAKTEEFKTIKEGLCKMMMDKGIKKFTTPVMQLTTVTPTPKKTFDSARFKEDYPDLYEQYTKVSEVKPSMRITFK